MTTDIDLAYIAGIVDGEGYIGIKKSKAYKCQGRVSPGYHARVQVRMVDEGAIRFLAHHLGGWYYKEHGNIPTRRLLFCYQASDLSASNILLKILPFLRIKNQQAKIVLKLRRLQKAGKNHRTKVTGTRTFSGMHGQKIRVRNLAFSDAYIARCEILYQKCKYLNRVGPRAEEVRNA